MSLDADISVTAGSLDLHVDLRVDDGEVLALLGPNGAGKSTILRAIAGLVPLKAGHLRIDGTTVDDPAADIFVAPEDRSIGMVFQDYALFDHMTVLDNVAFGLRARHLDKRTAHAQARDWLNRVGLDAYALERPGALSGGQAQRVALARALAPTPRLLLLDEPLAALDVGTRAEVRRDLLKYLGAHSGLRVLVTHDPVDAHVLADRVAIIEKGRVVQWGTLDEVTARPLSRYVADLVGINLVSGTVIDGHLITDDGTTVVVADAPPGRAHAIIRPHSITLTRQPQFRSSARNSWPGTIVGIERVGDRARVRLHGPLPLTAEVTLSSLQDLELRVGDEIHTAVKATEIDVSPA